LIKILLFSTIILLISGCSTRFKHSTYKNYSSKSDSSNIYIKAAKKHSINPKTLHAICVIESGEHPYAININTGKYKGSKYFKSYSSANNFMDRYLYSSNYDIGYCQINNWWLTRLNLNNEDLLDKYLNVDIAAKIYKDNVKRCKGEIVCALSMYNTGKGNSSIGKKYAKKVLRQRRKLYGY